MGFFFPQALFTGLMQAHALAHRVAVNELELLTLPVPSFSAPEDVKAPPDAGLYCHGMLIEGARFDVPTGLLAEAGAGELMSSMPLFHLRVMGSEELQQAKAAQKTYDCPYYKTNAREGAMGGTSQSANFVMFVALPTTEDESHWIRRGVALVAQNND